MSRNVSRIVLSAFAVNTLIFGGACGSQATHSSPKVTTVVSTPSKRQSIGNCWVYAQASWLETLLYKSKGEALNVSETYWTYWDWYHKISDKPSDMPGDFTKDENGRRIFSFQTGGSWQDAKAIILKYGFLYEAEVAPEEESLEMSRRQSSAETQIAYELTDGELSSTADRRDKEKVRKVLDRIFQVEMDALVEKGRDNLSTKIAVGRKLDKTAPLSQAIHYWKEVRFDAADGVRDPERIGERTQSRRKSTFKQIMNALNQGQPVLMSFTVYFDAMKIDFEKRMGIFDYKTLMDFKATNEVDPNNVGGHMVMLQDYSVTNVPGIGDLGFGDMSDELKSKALQGDLTMIKAKNSWGVSRAERGLFDGSTYFDIDYLTLPVEDADGFSSANLWDFVAPEYPHGL